MLLRPTAPERSEVMVGVKAVFGIAVLAAVPVLSNIDLQSGTLNAWEQYIQGADSQMQTRLDARKPFLWTDESPDRARRVRLGEIAVAPVVGHGTRKVADGLIHDWIGAVFIPGATIESLFAVMYD